MRRRLHRTFGGRVALTRPPGTARKLYGKPSLEDVLEHISANEAGRVCLRM